MANELNEAIRKIVRAMIRTEVAQAINGSLDAKVNAVIGNRLAVVDRLVAAVQGSNVSAAGPSKAGTRSRRNRRRNARPALQARSSGVSSPNKAANLPRSGTKQAKAGAPSSGKARTAPAISTAIGAKVTFKQGRGTFPGVISSRDAKTGMVTVKRTGDGKPFVRNIEGLYASK